MKKSLKRTLLLSLMLALLCALFTVCALAEESEEEDTRPVYTLTYYQADNNKGKELYREGDTVTLRTEAYTSNYTFYGWFTDSGELYAPGAAFEITRDITVYEARGVTVNNVSDLQSNLDKGWCYVKLGANLTVTERLDPNSCTGVLDLNGHTLTIKDTAYAMGAQRSGMIVVGKGTVNFTSNNTTDGAFFVTSRHGYDGDGNQRLWIGRDVTISSNVPLIRVENDMSLNPGCPTFHLWGSITCPYLVRSAGLQSVDVNVYDTAKINITGTDFPLLRDTSTYDDIDVISLVIHGGEFTFPSTIKCIHHTDIPEKYSVEISGGSFNIDISKYISVDYNVIRDDGGRYHVIPNLCSSSDSPDGYHKYLATRITVSCEKDGVVDYACEYCDSSYTAERLALGHNVVTMKTSDIVNTKSRTSPGVYTHTCGRCGWTDTEYFYPDPSTVYITVKVRYSEDGQTVTEELRIKSTELFGFTTDTSTELELKTYLNSFGNPKLEYTYPNGTTRTFKMSQILAVEIPLGTTRIFGTHSYGYNGIFYQNAYLEEITIPLSVEVVEKGAFAEMKKIKVINGIENISKEIQEYAFAQTADTSLVLDTLEINARTVGQNAFKNVLATRLIFGKNVKAISNGAFNLDSSISDKEAKYDNGKGMLKEIFLEALSEKYPVSEYPDLYGKPMSTSLGSLTAEERSDLFSSISYSGLMTKANVYYDHSYAIKVYSPTCLSEGYTAYECVQCGINTKSDFVSNEGITHRFERNEDYDAEPTCVTEGYTAEVCTICETVKKLETIPVSTSYSAHDFSTSELEPDYDACTSAVWHMRRRCANGCGTWSNSAGPQGSAVVLGHDFPSDDDDEGIVTIKPTCGTAGKTIKTCSRCYATEEIEKEATGNHSWVRNDAAKIEPTCAAMGQNTFNCEYCDAVDIRTIDRLSYEEAVDANVHKWYDDIILEPTTKSEGIKQVLCSVCGAQKANAGTFIPKLTDNSLPWWAIVLIVVGGLLALGGIALTLYLTLFKKNNASKNYKYKFNTFKK